MDKDQHKRALRDTRKMREQAVEWQDTNRRIQEKNRSTQEKLREQKGEERRQR